MGRSTVEFSANLAVLIFNEGKESTMQRLLGAIGGEKTQRVREYSKLTDKRRMYKSDRRASEVEKKRRKRRAQDREAAEEAAVERKGVTYGAGEF